MKKLLLIPVMGFSLTYPDFSLCYKKFKHYSLIPISKNYSITSKKPKKYLKYDEVYGIYLVKTKNKHYLHFKKSHIGVWLASIKQGSIYSGNYAEYPKENIPAKFSTKTNPGSIMSDIFCNPIGIGVNGGFLTTSQIKKFIKSKPQLKKSIFKEYGFIINKNLIITKIFKNSWAYKHFLTIGTKIVAINHKPVKNIKELKLHLTQNSLITFNINGFLWTIKLKG